MSFENHSLNSSWESNRLGMMKCSSAQSSVQEVQVRSRNLLEQSSQHTLHVVLNWGSGQQQPVPAMESKQRLPTDTGRVLNVLSLVENHILPLDTLEVLLILGDELVTGNQDVERSVLIIADLFLAPKLSKRRSIFDVTPVWEGLQGWDKASQLLLPIMKRRQGGNNEERSPDVVSFREVSQK